MRSDLLRAGLRRRAWPLAAVPVTIVAGLGARALLGGLAAKVAGDALYTVLVYVLVLVVKPDASVRRAFAVALGVSFAIEFAQITPYPAWLSSKHVLLRLIFGTTFGFVDLAGYVVGAVCAAAVHAAITRRAVPAHARMRS
jgi:sugar phosphate permease